MGERPKGVGRAVLQGGMIALIYNQGYADVPWLPKKRDMIEAGIDPTVADGISAIRWQMQRGIRLDVASQGIRAN